MLRKSEDGDIATSPAGLEARLNREPKRYTVVNVRSSRITRTEYSGGTGGYVDRSMQLEFIEPRATRDFDITIGPIDKRAAISSMVKQPEGRARPAESHPLARNRS